jgi:hypothetical protein
MPQEKKGFQTPAPKTGQEQARQNLARSLLLGIVLSTALAAQNPPPSMDAEQLKLLVQRSTEITDKNWSVQAEYDWCETDLQHDGTTKTFEELMLLGSRYERLVAINGKPLSTAQAEEEKQKLLQAIAQRRAESEEQRNRRIAKEQAEMKRDHDLLDQVAAAMEFSYVGEQKMDGHDVYLIGATPKPGYRPPNKETEVLKGARGQLWIDKETLNWVKVEAQVMKPVWIVGFVARVEPGTRFDLEMTPISGSFWLPAHYAMKARARILLLFPHQSQEDQTYFGYHKAAEHPGTTDGSNVPVTTWLDHTQCSM